MRKIHHTQHYLIQNQITLYFCQLFPEYIKQKCKLNNHGKIFKKKSQNNSAKKINTKRETLSFQPTIISPLDYKTVGDTLKKTKKRNTILESQYEHYWTL